MKKILLSVLFFVTGEKKVSFKTLLADLISGLTVAVIAIPQAIAYAFIAGVRPIYGLFSMFIPSIISAIFGSSKHLHTGPTNATSILVFSAIFSLSGNGQILEKIFLIAVLSGLIRIFMGLMKMGNFLNFVSVPVLVGFVSGAGTLIAGNQLKNLCGIEIPNQLYFYDTIFMLFRNIEETNIYTFLIGLFSVFMIVGIRKINKKIPGIFFSILFSSILVALLGLENYGVATVGEIPHGFPAFSFYKFSLKDIRETFFVAAAIAILGSIEALSISKTIASRSGQELSYNRELIAQGISNISSGFFQGIPISGSFSRSMINFNSKGVSKLSLIFSGIFVGIFLMFFTTILRFIPIASLSGVLIVVAWNMISKRQIKIIFSSSRSDIAVFLITLISCLFLKIEYAVFVGVILSFVVIINYISVPRILEVVPSPFSRKLLAVSRTKHSTCPQITIFEMFGEFFFGSIQEIGEKIKTLTRKKPKVIIFRFKGIDHIDASGLIFLRKIIRNASKKGISFILRGTRSKLKKELEKSGVLEILGKDNFVYNTEQALKRSYEIIDKERCRKCKLRVFKECDRIRSKEDEIVAGS